MGNLWQKQPDSYHGLLMRCAPGTHEAAAKMLGDNRIANCPVLDLASGSGAFLARLCDPRFDHRHAVDLDPSRFGLPGIKPIAADLNADFASVIDAALGCKRFGLVSAIEIIEHLDCPRHFLRQVRTLLADDGHLLLSTPNVANFTGRIRFAVSGQLRQFRENDYHYQRHISPIAEVQMRLMLGEIGFRLVDAVTAGCFFGPVKKAVLSPAILLARLLWGSIGSEDVRIYLAQKSAPDTTSPGRSSDYIQRGA